MSKIFFRPFGPQFGLKIRGAGPPGPFPGSAIEVLQVCLVARAGGFTHPRKMQAFRKLT